MTVVRRVLLGAASLLLSGFISIVLLVLFGVALPIFAMIAIFGRQNVQDAPGHGGAVLLLTVPLAAIVSLGVLLVLIPFFYRKFSN